MVAYSLFLVFLYTLRSSSEELREQALFLY